MPMQNSMSRRTLGRWFDEHDIRPNVVGEFQDISLLNVFGQAGVGIFASPTVVEDQVRKYHQVALVGRLDTAKEEFYAISAERRIKHPAVAAISQSARQSLFTKEASL